MLHGSVCRLSHSLLWGAVLAVYLCSGSLTSLEFKLLLSVTVPVRRPGAIHPIICTPYMSQHTALLVACVRLGPPKSDRDDVGSSGASPDGS
jgi:hypothetical protein